jgi:hypothetical protein
MTENPKLKKLNQDTFTAEMKETVNDEEWDMFLWRVLSDDFQIRRANLALLPQDKREMITHIRYSKNPPKRDVSEVSVFEDGDYGVVTCIVTLEGQSDKFHNIKVFTRQSSGDWQCVYWRVSKLLT